jgi:uncharacterized protein YjiS (DUF1127 family)
MISFIIGSAKPALAAVGALGRAFGVIGHWLQSRRDYRTLCDMNERDLRDIVLRGLSTGTPGRPERIAKESDSAGAGRVVFLRAAE